MSSIKQRIVGLVLFACIMLSVVSPIIYATESDGTLDSGNLLVSTPIRDSSALIPMARSNFVSSISHIKYTLTSDIVDGTDTGMKNMLFTIYGTISSFPSIPVGYQGCWGYITYGSSDGQQYYQLSQGTSTSSSLGEFSINGYGSRLPSSYKYYKIVFGIWASNFNMGGGTDNIFYPGDSLSFTKPSGTIGILFKDGSNIGEWEIPPVPNTVTPLSKTDAREFLSFLVGQPLSDNQVLHDDYYKLLTGQLRGKPSEAEVKLSFVGFVDGILFIKSKDFDHQINFALTQMYNYLNSEIDEYTMKNAWDCMNVFIKNFLDETIQVHPEKATEYWDKTLFALNSVLSAHLINEKNRLSYMSGYLSLRPSGINDHFNLLMDTNATVLSITRWDFLWIKDYKSRLDRWSEYVYNLDRSIGHKFTKQITVSCPVEVNIFKEDLLVVSLKNEEASTLFTEYGNFYVIENSDGNFTKIAQVDGSKYEIEIIGLNDGTMNYSVSDLSTAETSYSATNIPINANTKILTNSEISSNSYLEIDSDGDGSINSIVPLQKDTVPIITTPNLTDGTTGNTYFSTLSVKGTLPVKWSIVSGKLPGGLIFTNGEISGIPLTAGIFNFTIKAENVAGIDVKDFVITIKDSQPIVDSIAISPATSNMQRGSSQQFSAIISGTNTPIHSVIWSVVGGASGTKIDAKGLLTVALDERASALTVTATSIADSQKHATATITLTDSPFIKYRLTVQGGTGSGDYVKGTHVTIQSDMVQENKRFKTWEASGITGVDLSKNQITIVMPANNVTLSAVYEEIPIVTYTITFDSNGGYPIAPITNIIPNSTINLPIPIRSGYSFEGWFSTAEGGIQYTNLTQITSDMILYARWKRTDQTSNSGNSSGNANNTTSGDDSIVAFTPPRVGIIGNTANSYPATEDMLRDAFGNITIYGGVRFANVTSISPQIAISVATGTAEGTKIFADTVDNNTVLARMYIDPVEAGNLEMAIDTRIDTSEAATINIQTLFKKWFSNKMVFVALGQQTPFGIPIKFALKPNLSDLDTTRLYGYIYNPKTNKYNMIASPQVGRDGYLYITTSTGGVIIITDEPLAKR